VQATPPRDQRGQCKRRRVRCHARVSRIGQLFSRRVAQRLNPNAATTKSAPTRIRAVTDARSGDADRCWLQSPPVASPNLRELEGGHDERVAGGATRRTRTTAAYPFDPLPMEVRPSDVRFAALGDPQVRACSYSTVSPSDRPGLVRYPSKHLCWPPVSMTVRRPFHSSCKADR
jgi:hypothetical protein